MAISRLGQAGKLHDVDAATEQFVLHLPGERNELVQAAAAGDQHRCHQIALAQRIHRRRFDFVGKAANLRNALLDAIHRVLQVRIGVDLHLHERPGVPRDAPHRLHVGNGLQLLLQRRGDEFLHVLGTGAAPADLRVDVGARLVGIQLHVQPGDGPHASQHHQHHAEVGGQAMFDEGANQVHGDQPRVRAAFVYRLRRALPPSRRGEPTPARLCVRHVRMHSIFRAKPAKRLILLAFEATTRRLGWSTARCIGELRHAEHNCGTALAAG